MGYNLLSEIEETPLLHSRLAFLSDKGGKVRVVGIGDSISQSLLSVVHKYLFTLLKRIDEDCTFDQDKGRERARSFSKEGYVASIDMSACTDRLPVWLQAFILKELCLSEEQALS